MKNQKRDMVYIAHPMAGRSGDIKENFKNNILMIEKICQYMMGKIKFEMKKSDSIFINDEITPWFFAPQLFIPTFINESQANEEEFAFSRKIAIEFCMAFVDRVDGIHVYKPEELSRGVMDDIERAAKMGKYIKFKEKYPWQE